jgi:hypothetical protein
MATTHHGGKMTTEQLPLSTVPDEVLDRARAFIAAYAERVGWSFAKTMPEDPHQYALREKAAGVGLEGDFEWLVLAIREHGYRQRYGATKYTYLAIDGERLWSMGNPLPETTVLNRTPLTLEAQRALRDANTKESRRMRVSLRVPKDLYDQLHDMAEEQDTTLNALVLSLVAGAISYRPTPPEDAEKAQEATEPTADERKLA